MRLFIIGNGFDLAHGLQTKYIHFRQYLEEVNPSYLIQLEEMYSFSPLCDTETVEQQLWQNFEYNLSEIDEDILIDGAISTTEDLGLDSGNIGVEDTLNNYWEGQYGFIQKLNDYLKSWIQQVDINVSKKTNQIGSDRNDLFLTFNYTLVLEQVYNIDSDRILHIHGSLDEDSAYEPVIGHGNFLKISNMKSKIEEAVRNFNEASCSIYKMLRNYYDRTLKDVQFYLNCHSSFFERLKQVDEIIIIGHSLGEVDMPYFKKILDIVEKDIVWNVYYYNEDDRINYMDRILNIGINGKDIKMIKTNNFFI